MQEDTTHTFSLRLPQDMDQILAEAAKKSRRSKNNLVVIILEDWVKEQRSKSESPKLET